MHTEDSRSLLFLKKFLHNGKNHAILTKENLIQTFKSVQRGWKGE